MSWIDLLLAHWQRDVRISREPAVGGLAAAMVQQFHKRTAKVNVAALHEPFDFVFRSDPENSQRTQFSRRTEVVREMKRGGFSIKRCIRHDLIKPTVDGSHRRRNNCIAGGRYLNDEYISCLGLVYQL